MSEDVDIARVAHTLKAIMEVVSKDPGMGTIDCPKCGGKMHYALERTKKRQSYTAKCSTADCIEFSGH